VAGRGRQHTRKTPFTEAPIRELRQLAIEAGWDDPDELTEEMADWCADRDHRSADWLAFGRRWIRREPRFARHTARERPVHASVIFAERRRMREREAAL
jgi:hypothetical protein